MRGISLPEMLRTSGYFRPDSVTAMLARQWTGQDRRGRVLLTVLALQLWCDLFMPRPH